MFNGLRLVRTNCDTVYLELLWDATDILLFNSILSNVTKKKTKIKVIPVNSAVDILLSNHPKMDNLLAAYENQTTGSLWKIMQTSSKN